MTGAHEPVPPPTLRSALLRKFATARVPGSLATPLVADPVEAADLAAGVAEAFITEALRSAATEQFTGVIGAVTDFVMTQKLAQMEAAVRADERKRCAVLLREWAVDLWTAPDGAPGYLRATAVSESADLLDPPGASVPAVEKEEGERA